MKEKSTFSFRKGLSYIFEDDGNVIEAWSSIYSGKEKIFVNNKLVSTKRSFSKLSASEFKSGGYDYKIELNTPSLRKGPFICTLYKNNIAIKRQKLIFNNFRKSNKKIKFKLNWFDKSKSIKFHLIELLKFSVFTIIFYCVIRYFKLSGWSVFWLVVVALLVLMIADPEFRRDFKRDVADDYKNRPKFNPVFEEEDLS